MLTKNVENAKENARLVKELNLNAQPVIYTILIEIIILLNALVETGSLKIRIYYANIVMMNV